MTKQTKNTGIGFNPDPIEWEEGICDDLSGAWLESHGLVDFCIENESFGNYKLWAGFDDDLGVLIANDLPSIDYAKFLANEIQQQLILDMMGV